MTVANFKARYPQFTQEDAIIQPILEECKLFVSLETFQAKTEVALFLLVAHELTIQEAINNNSDTDKIISRSIEGGSVTIAHTQGKDTLEAYYQKTIYGEKFLAIKKSVRFVGAVLT
ncbi:MAG: DUF4054 domain-containing protein [Erysipelotrichia bacterium]|nr:DUF4054 domain-containing protein [Erysipelotrichia bacterium]